MFDFLFQDRNKEIRSLAEIIAVDMEKLNLSKLAIEKAIMMIAKAIAKSDILIQTESKEKNKKEYRLNVQPNDHECGTVFWTEVVKQLLTEQEALIIPLNGKYYRATSWSNTNEVMLKRVYKDVMLSCGGENLTIFSTFQSDEVIHLRYDNARIRLYLQNVVEVSVIAFPDDTISKMRGETKGTGGLILAGGKSERPFFAYGKVVKLKNGKSRYEWFPKCKLVENSDDIATSEEKASEQTDTIKIRAYPFDAEGNIVSKVTESTAPAGLTEEKFFAKPILTDADLTTAIGA